MSFLSLASRMALSTTVAATSEALSLPLESDGAILTQRHWLFDAHLWLTRQENEVKQMFEMSV